jgi:hypothetical protein
MSAIEAKVKDIAIPMMQGKHLDLTIEMQTTLAQWVTLKVLVAESNKLDEAVFPQDVRDAFQKNKTVPPYVRVWVGRCIDEPWHSALVRNAALLAINTNIPPNAGRKNVQTTAIGIGELFIYSMACVTEGMDMNDFIRFDNRLIPLWPISERILIWPPMKIISGKNATSIALALDNLIRGPQTFWAPD